MRNWGGLCDEPSGVYLCEKSDIGGFMLYEWKKNYLKRYACPHMYIHRHTNSKNSNVKFRTCCGRENWQKSYAA